MKHGFIANAAMVSLLCLLIASNVRAAGDDKGPTGTIKGTISVSGVKSPENVLVYLEEVTGDWPPPKEPAGMRAEVDTLG